jgi:DNA polymerase III subunit delta
VPLIESPELYKSVEKALKEEKFHPIYFFFGEEPYLVTQALQYVKTCALYGATADFNFSSYYAADADVVQVRDEVDTLPMMASRRVVVVREAQDFTDKEWEELSPILESPVESTVLIISASKIDKRKKYFKTLIDSAQATEFRKPFENQIPGWIRHISKAHQVELSEPAEQLFHRLVGNQLHEIETEIKKLREYVGEGKLVEIEDVAQCVSKRREKIFLSLQPLSLVEIGCKLCYS